MASVSSVILRKGFDTVVIGAGTAGSIIAGNLAFDGVKTLLIERGSMNDLPGWLSEMPAGRVYNRLTQRYPAVQETQGTTNNTVSLQSARICGGACVTGDLSWVPGFAEEYASWWPAERLTADFVDVERRSVPTGMSPRGAVLSKSSFNSLHYKMFLQGCCDTLGCDFENFEKVGPLKVVPPSGGIVGRAPVRITANGEAATTFRQYVRSALKDAVASRSLTVSPNTEAEKVVITQKTAQAIEVVMKDERILVPCARVVLCAGAIESPRLLAASGITAAGLGSNLHDVVEASLTVPLSGQPYSLSYLAATSPLVLGSIRAEWQFRRDGWGTSDFSDTIAIVQSKKIEKAFLSLSLLPYGSTTQPDITLVARVATPFSRGLVTRDIIESPHLNDARDKILLEEALDLAKALVTRSKDFSKCVNGNELRVQAPRSASQCGGTCALGTVVDASTFRVNETDNTFVCDSSVVPKPLTGGLTPAVMMLASSFGKS